MLNTNNNAALFEAVKAGNRSANYWPRVATASISAASRATTFASSLATTHAIADPYDRWTHHYNGDDTYGALDHIFLSPALALRNPRPHVRIVRGGTPFRARRYEGARFPGVGWSEPKASDHCPLATTLQFEGRPLEL